MGRWSRPADVFKCDPPGGRIGCAPCVDGAGYIQSSVKPALPPFFGWGGGGSGGVSGHRSCQNGQTGKTRYLIYEVHHRLSSTTSTS